MILSKNIFNLSIIQFENTSKNVGNMKPSEHNYLIGLQAREICIFL